MKSNDVRNNTERVGASTYPTLAKLTALQATLRRGLVKGEILMHRLGATETQWNNFLKGY